MSTGTTGEASQQAFTPRDRPDEDPIEILLQRLGFALAGLGLVISGAGRSLPVAMVAAAGGGALLYRAANAGDVRRAEPVRTGGPFAGCGLEDGPLFPFAIRRTITVGKSADDLYTLWREPRTLETVMKGSFDVVAESESTALWHLDLPAGQYITWRTVVVEERSGELLRWQSREDSPLPHQGTIWFRPAPGDLGTEVTLEFAFDPPPGAIGEGAMKIIGALPVVSQWLPSFLAGKPLHRFKSLTESGEIPTTAGQPMARADTGRE